MTALYVTVWLSLAMLAAGEIANAAGRRGALAGRLHLAGALLMIAHLVAAMSVVHHWSHEAAARATAAQTARVFGVDWGGGLWVNYAFIAGWVAYGWRLAIAPDAASPWRWGFRAWTLIMVANGAIVFAAPDRRTAGAIIMVVLLWSWWRHARRSR